MTLAERVLEAIEAAERVARSATAGPWTIRNLGRHDQAAVVVDTGLRTPVAGLPVGALVGEVFNARAVADARHIALNDPAAVLRRCAADRAIVERWKAMEEAPVPEFGEPEEDGTIRLTLEWVVKRLAEAYGVPL